jgi:trimeric autotransporter adhesin
MRIRFPAALLAFAALFPAATAFAQCPDWKTGPLDNTSVDGANGAVYCSYYWDPDGGGPLPTYLVVGGAFTSIQGVAANHIAMRDPYSGQWQALGAGVGTVPLALTVWNGKLVVGGTGNNNPADTDNNLLTYDGSTWTSLYGGTSTGSVFCLGVLNGELYAGGNFVIYPTVLDIATNIAHWNTSHGLWENVAGPGTNPGQNVYCMTNWNGNLWVGTYYKNGTILGAGDVWQFDGVNWTDMVQTDNAVEALQPWNGVLVAGGYFDVVGTSSIRSVMAYNGSYWYQLAVSGMDNGVTDLTVFGGKLYAGGYFTHADGNSANYVAVYSGGSWQGLNGGTNSYVHSLIPMDAELVVGGEFTQADGASANHMALWDGHEWAPFGGGNVSGVLAMNRYGGYMVAGGAFNQSAGAGTPAHNIVAWNGVSLTPFGIGMDNQINALKSYVVGNIITQTNELVAGGYFLNAGGVACNYIARWDQGIVAFPPPAWAAMSTGFDGSVQTIERATVAGVTNTYAGGTFQWTGAGVPPVYLGRIARWNASSQLWESVGGGMDGVVYALKAFNGYLYAGGSFTNAGGVSTGGLARWDGTSWHQVGGFFGGTVLALEVYNGRLVMAGTFPGFGGSPNISSTDGIASYFNLGSGGASSTITTLHTAGNKLYVGGSFGTIGGVSASHIGYYDGLWHAMTAGVDLNPYAIGDFNGEVQVGGVFNVAGTVPLVTKGWARWSPTGIPWFTSQSFSVSANPGATFSISAVPVSGYSGVTEQWYRNGVLLLDGPSIPGSLVSGATTPTLTITNASPFTVATYTAVLTNACGSDTSSGINMTLPGSTGVGPDHPFADLFESIGPNPTHGSSVLSFSLARDSDVQLRVLDIAGRRLSHVDFGRLAAGRHQMTWEARDDEGGTIHSGMYFVSLEVNGQLLGNKRVAIVR